eukprot:m51a1_g11662 hypothetical protein (110) ;mRNA; f:72-401
MLQARRRRLRRRRHVSVMAQKPASPTEVSEASSAVSVDRRDDTRAAAASVTGTRLNERLASDGHLQLRHSTSPAQSPCTPVHPLNDSVLSLLILEHAYLEATGSEHNQQ